MMKLGCDARRSRVGSVDDASGSACSAMVAQDPVPPGRSHVLQGESGSFQYVLTKKKHESQRVGVEEPPGCLPKTHKWVDASNHSVKYQ
jgi:hypothetical protein